MTRRGDLFLEDGVVVAIEPGGAKGTRIFVETDVPVSTRMSGAAAGYEGRAAAQPLKVRVVYVTAPRWAEIVDEWGGQDMLLARRVTIADLGPAAVV